MRILVPLLSVSFFLHAQAPAPSVPPAWDITPVIADFAEKGNRLAPLLQELAPQEWVKNGAPDAYLSQLVTAQQELTYFLQAAKLFEQQPDKLTLALDTYFRWQSLHSRLDTLREGARRYQDATLGDLLESVFTGNAPNQDKLRQYMTDLASQKEEEFTVVNKESQRCRETITRQPPATRNSGPAKP